MERDEDVEIVHDTETWYVQVKTRSSPLAPSDITGLLERFATIRSAHQRGERSGAARFALVVNTELGRSLSAIVWPPDMVVLTPTGVDSATCSGGLIVPTRTLEELLRLSVELAQNYRQSALRPDSLVAKLVALVAQASAGGGWRNGFATNDLDQLCELVTVQLSPLPRIQDYRSQQSEPDLSEDEGRRSLIVTGYSGNGKSAWAAEIAAHSPDTVVYVPCSAAPGEQLASRLFDACVSTVSASMNRGAYEFAFPGRNGTYALSRLNTKLDEMQLRVTVVVDDCHYLPSQMIVDCVRATPWLRWLILGHPSRTVDEVAALTGFDRVSLGGWDTDTIAAVLQSAGCSTSVADVAALQEATGGAPLFVQHAVRVIGRSSMDTGEYARAIVDGTTSGQTEQEIISEGAIRALDEAVACVASGLASIEVGFRADEWCRLLEAVVGVQASQIRRGLRTVVSRHIAYETHDGIIAVHDVFRPILNERFISAEQSTQLRERTVALLRGQLLNGHASRRIVAYARTLARLGRLSELADIANALAEWFRETGGLARKKWREDVSYAARAPMALA